MAKNTNDDFRRGAVRHRSQFIGPNGNPIKRDDDTGRFMDQKTTPGKFKGVRTEHKLLKKLKHKVSHTLCSLFCAK